MVPIKGKGDMNVYWVTQRQRAGGNRMIGKFDWEAATTTYYHQHQVLAHDSSSCISL
jgi:hypothetical protein